MSPYHNSNYYLWIVSKKGDIYNNSVYEDYATVRPVVTLRKKPIEVYYNISTKIDNHGVVKLNKKQALEDEKVTLFITANAGYKLNSLKIYKTNDNEDVTDKVGYNNETNEFIMPDYDVTVSAKFEKIIDNNETIEKENTSDNQNKIENPNTTDKISIYIIVSSLGVGALIIFMLCKRKFNIN